MARRRAAAALLRHRPEQARRARAPALADARLLPGGRRGNPPGRLRQDEGRGDRRDVQPAEGRLCPMGHSGPVPPSPDRGGAPRREERIGADRARGRARSPQEGRRRALREGQGVARRGVRAHHKPARQGSGRPRDPRPAIALPRRDHRRAENGREGSRRGIQAAVQGSSRERGVVSRRAGRQPARARREHRTPPGQGRALLRHPGRSRAALRALVLAHRRRGPRREELPHEIRPRATTRRARQPHARDQGQQVGRRVKRRERGVARAGRGARPDQRTSGGTVQHVGTAPRSQD